ncbi:hypothetical protein H8K20_04155 [Neobittarella massiliensis]|uniref:Uncharacterized protein n=1 Tax=Neobittarella massiliensis (ex Bilen et al. 2018) TaxID=2041842 RepID=A0A8J6IMM7_9FIRM|nr:hypothetical protein [Neobittarella massiliensis]MBC3515592.1 hypothetical protein [Neobittarella massiliensis]
MDLVNNKVKSKALGIGTVIEQDDSHIIVQFAAKKSTFQYPEAFRKFLTVEDDEIQQTLLAEITAADALIAEAKIKAEETRKAAEQAKLEELDAKSERKTTSKPAKRIERMEGQHLIFLVFQGGTFAKEYKGGYIWAPKLNQGGGTCHHWDKMLDVRKGDIILHCADGLVEAISVAKGPCFDCESPDELAEEKLWAKNGRMVNCDYVKIQKPIRHSDYKHTILNYCCAKYSPFDKDGNGNMGYLFDLDRELAKFFVEKTIINNSYLLGLECVQEVLK